MKAYHGGKVVLCSKVLGQLFQIHIYWWTWTLVGQLAAGGCIAYVCHERLNTLSYVHRKSKAIHKLAKLLDELKFESISEEQLQAIRDQFRLVSLHRSILFCYTLVPMYIHYFCQTVCFIYKEPSKGHAPTGNPHLQ